MGKVENCLVCNGIVNFDDSGPSYSCKRSYSSNIVKHLSVIFILRNVLEVPVEQVANQLERNPEIQDWITLCERCSAMLEKCRSIYSELVEISKRYKACRLEIIKIVKDSSMRLKEAESLQKCVIDSKEQYKGSKTEDCSFVEQVRRLTVNRTYENLIDPDCEKGDVLAVVKKNEMSQRHVANDLCLCEDAVVKVEVGDETKMICNPPEKINLPLKIEEGEDNTSHRESDDDWQADMENSDSDTKTGRSMDSDSDDNASSVPEEEEGEDDWSDEDSNQKGCKKKLRGRRRNGKVVNCPFCKSHPLSISHNRNTISYTCRHLFKCSTDNNEKNVKAMKMVTDLKCDICSQYSCSVDDICGFVYHMLCCAYLDKNSESKLPPIKNRIFRCNICQEEKVNKSHLLFFDLERFLEHYHFHKGLTYQCTECEQVFLNIDGFRTHWRATHKELLASVADYSTYQRKLDSPPLPAVPWWCPKCGEVFSEESKRDEHFQTTHPSNSRASEPEKDVQKCQFCDKEYHCLDELTVHQVTAHGLTVNCKNLFHCDACTDTFLSKKFLQLHRRSVHKLHRFKCQVCKKSFKQQIVLTEHMKIHQKTDVEDKEGDSVKMNFECGLCAITYVSEKSLAHHISVVHEKTVEFSCHICGKNFTLKKSLRMHLAAIHEIGRVIRIHCKVEGCGKTFNNKQNYKIHVAIHDKNSVYPCTFCGKEFYTALNLKRHERRLHNNSRDPSNQLQCDQCPFQTASLSHFKRHKNRAHNPDQTDISKIPKRVVKVKKPKPSQCSNCGKICKSAYALNKHSLVHQPEKRNFVCDICGKAFTLRSDLTNHKERTLQCKRLHMTEEEATVACDICQKRYSCKFTLAKHIRERHEGIFSEICEHCGKGLEDKSKLAGHLAKVHKIADAFVRARTLKCPEAGCEKLFSRKRDLEDHVSKHRGEPGYKCKECEKSFYTSGYLSQHVNYVHRGYRWKGKAPKAEVDVTI